MRNTSIRIDYLSGLIQDAENNFSLSGDKAAFDFAIEELRKNFPGCTESEIVSIIQLCVNTVSAKTKEKSELVITAPEAFNLKSKRIKDALNNLLLNARKSVLLTGYSVSEYFDGLIDIIVNKSRQGIYYTLTVLKNRKTNWKNCLHTKAVT